MLASNMPSSWTSAPYFSAIAISGASLACPRSSIRTHLLAARPSAASICSGVCLAKRGLFTGAAVTNHTIFVTIFSRHPPFAAACTSIIRAPAPPLEHIADWIGALAATGRNRATRVHAPSFHPALELPSDVRPITLEFFGHKLSKPSQRTLAISDRAIRIVTVSSLAMCTQALTFPCRAQRARAAGECLMRVRHQC